MVELLQSSQFGSKSKSREMSCHLERAQRVEGPAFAPVSPGRSKKHPPENYDENDEPQPQEREEFGLMKLNPCRISVSS
jgi:hypothetical protein